MPGFVRTPVLPVNAEGCSASDASCVGRDPGYVDAMLPGFISFPGDVDWFRIPNVRAGARITADLTNLPLDADLVLYGPAGISSAPSVFPSAQDLPGRFVEDAGLGVGRAAAAVAAEALNDLKLDQGYHDPYAGDVDVPAMTPLSISQHHGTDPESVGVIAPVDGDYVIQVSGYNGKESDDPYLVRARVFTPTSESTCVARLFPNPTPAPGAIPAIAADVNTVFLTNPGRLAATYGATEANTVATKLANLVTYLNGHPALGLKAAVVPVDAYPGLGGAYTAWDQNPCSVSRRERRRDGDHRRPPGRPDVRAGRGLRDPRRWRRHPADGPHPRSHADRQRVGLRDDVRRRAEPDLGRRGRGLPAHRRRVRRHAPDVDRRRQLAVRPAARGRPSRGDPHRDQRPAPGLRRRRGRQARHRHRDGGRVRLPRGRRGHRQGPPHHRRPDGRRHPHRPSPGRRPVDELRPPGRAVPDRWPLAVDRVGQRSLRPHRAPALRGQHGRRRGPVDRERGAWRQRGGQAPQPAPVHDGLPCWPRGARRLRARDRRRPRHPAARLGAGPLRRPRSPSTSRTPGSASATPRPWPTRSA